MLPPQITTFLFAMTPIFELRGALPWALTIGQLSLAEALFFSVAGNIFVSVLLIYLLPLVNWFAKKYWPWADRILQKIFAKTRAKHSKNFVRFEKVFLATFVAIPLPGSGAWTGVLLAWLFGVEKKWAIFLISLGVLISGILVAGLTTGAIAFVKFF
ncbi:MAG: small multi-drug export protein [Patescibacteria group bacterium]